MERLLPSVSFCVAVVAFRLLCAAGLATYGNPDEYWQAPEIAHRLVYGTGYATWEWWPSAEIRGGAHPLLLAGALQLSQVATGSTAPHVVAAVPRVAHALLTATADVSVYVASAVLNGHAFYEPESQTRKMSHHIAATSALAHLASWFVAFGGPRPLVNSLEGALFSIGLASWLVALPNTFIGDAGGASPAGDSGREGGWPLLVVAGLMAGLGVGSRPTVAILWLFIGLHYLAAHRLCWRSVLRLLPGFFPAALLGLAANAACDLAVYGHATSPMINFFRFNILYGVDRFYGSYSALWYVYDGIPATCGVFLPAALVGSASFFMSLWGRAGSGGAELHQSCGRRNARLLLTVLCLAWFVAVMSLAAHKEHRFLLPASCLVALLAGRGMWACASAFPMSGLGTSLQQLDIWMRNVPRLASFGNRGGLAWLIIGALVAANAIASVYFNQVHQRGPLSVMRHLQREAYLRAALLVRPARYHPQLLGARAQGSLFDEHVAATGSAPWWPWTAAEALGIGGSSESFGLQPAAALMTVHALMPCHSLPFHSVLHSPLARLLQLDCSPPTAHYNASAAAGRPQVSESQLWVQHPLRLLQALYGYRVDAGSVPASPLACAFEGAGSSGPLSSRASVFIRRWLYSNFAFISSGAWQPQGEDMDPKWMRPLAPGVALGGSAESADADFMREMFATDTHLLRLALDGSPIVAEDSSDSPPPLAVVAAVRALPTHIVIFDTDAGDVGVARFLASSGYAKTADFFHALHTGDAHSLSKSDPGRVHLFEHECSRRLLTEGIGVSH